MFFLKSRFLNANFLKKTSLNALKINKSCKICFIDNDQDVVFLKVDHFHLGSNFVTIKNSWQYLSEGKWTSARDAFNNCCPWKITEAPLNILIRV